MFIETPRFPECIAIRSTGGAGWNTSVVVLNSGYEQRNQPWSQARYTYEVSQVPQTPAYFEPLQHLFVNTQGKTHGFRLKDPQDFTATAAQGFFRTITATTFQLVKRYTFGANTQDRDITKPVSGTVATSGISVSGLSIDYTTGIATVATGTLQNWSGEFDVPCRFGVDQMQGDIVDKQAGSLELLIAWSSIPIIEIRV